ncbi:hypothetical protein BDV36DRAFT_302809 [Aspergillus pseudocaelatus]|uniref:Uncharacterized protein n=1 Tax=Aspergillus pseudocaelatus TaxID=1825620 RepID=A0ABQ6W1A0_9EURO|nr:hypothetical protein BDV36DRAFT_302809 [Aspergillus pseudocaelatus]
MGCPSTYAMPINVDLAKTKPSISTHTGPKVGLGISIPLIIGIVVVVWLYLQRRRKRAANKDRDNWLRELSLTTQRELLWHPTDPYSSCEIKKPPREAITSMPQQPPSCVVREGRLLLCTCHRPLVHHVEIRRAEIRRSTGAGDMCTILEE